MALTGTPHQPQAASHLWPPRRPGRHHVSKKRPLSKDPTGSHPHATVLRQRDFEVVREEEYYAPSLTHCPHHSGLLSLELHARQAKLRPDRDDHSITAQETIGLFYLLSLNLYTKRLLSHSERAIQYGLCGRNGLRPRASTM